MNITLATLVSLAASRDEDYINDNKNKSKNENIDENKNKNKNKGYNVDGPPVIAK
jgi:hypothetical protein